MLKKTITYIDYNGVEQSEDFYFNLTKAELIELELAHAGGLSESLKRIVAAQDGNAIIREFKNIILKAYGERSEDGKRFVKSDEISARFAATEAYSVLFVQLVTDADEAAKFVSAVMPQDLMAQAQLTLNEIEKPVVLPVEPRTITPEQAAEMDAAELQAGLGSGALVFAQPNV